MPDRVRVGIVGASWYPDLMHLPSLKNHPHAELRSICSRTGDSAAKMAKKYGIPQVFTDYRAMIEQGDLDALIVAAPDELHYAITMYALDAGLHVLCEKPLALTAKEACAMYEKATAAGVKHMTYFTYRWIAPYRYLHELIDQNYLGRCFDCNVRYLGSYGRAAQYGWRFDGQRSHGILGDIGSHMIDLARWCVGDIARVSAHLATYVKRPGADGAILDPANDAAVLAVEFVNGAHGVIQVSAVAHIGDRGDEQHIVLHGAGGTLEADYSFKSIEVRGARQAEEQLQVLPVPDALRGHVDASAPFLSQMFQAFGTESIGTRLFIDAIRDDRPLAPSFYDGWKTQEVLEAAVESHRTGRWITLPRQ
jgi:predicted dehydrogenase